MSYARRLAEANGATPALIERTVRSNGYPLPAGRESEERRQLWRHLGALSPEAFTEPVTFEGDEVVARPLCLRCCTGQVARGRLPYTGWVCARHRRWIGPVQYDVRGLPALIAAEQRFRRVLAPRAVVVDSPVYRLAGQAASQALDRTCLNQRAQQLGFDAPPQELLVYPETVRLACLITDPRFLDVAFTRSPEQRRLEFVTAQVERVLTGHEGSWLAVRPI